MSRSTQWRQARWRAARDSILGAAWEIAREEGVARLSIRELAKRAGITTPTVYAYFESKHAIYDAMFAEGNRELLTATLELPDAEFDVFLRDVAHRMHRFMTSDSARYQLLFQRSIPHFEPSSESYATAVEVLTLVRRRFHEAGIDDRGFDLWTCISSGLASQSLANDPGGGRYEPLIDDAVDMFLNQVGYRKTNKRKGTRR